MSTMLQCRINCKFSFRMLDIAHVNNASQRSQKGIQPQGTRPAARESAPRKYMQRQPELSTDEVDSGVDKWCGKPVE